MVPHGYAVRRQKLVAVRAGAAEPLDVIQMLQIPEIQDCVLELHAVLLRQQALFHFRQPASATLGHIMISPIQNSCCSFMYLTACCALQRDVWFATS
jgi:hypothetical protein